MQIMQINLWRKAAKKGYKNLLLGVKFLIFYIYYFWEHFVTGIFAFLKSALKFRRFNTKYDLIKNNFPSWMEFYSNFRPLNQNRKKEFKKSEHFFSRTVSNVFPGRWMHDTMTLYRYLKPLHTFLRPWQCNSAGWAQLTYNREHSQWDQLSVVQ
jgi:hypothetical protein